MLSIIEITETKADIEKQFDKMRDPQADYCDESGLGRSKGVPISLGGRGPGQGTKRNSAPLSMNLLINQGHATLSTWTRDLVTHFIVFTYVD